jgi:hypothetical protein
MFAKMKNRIEYMKKTFGTRQPTFEELQKLNFTRELFEQVCHGYLGLNDAIIKCFNSPPKFHLSEKNFPSQKERDFAHNVMGVIDVILKHEVEIKFLNVILKHDLEEIFRHGTLDGAIENGFLPKVTGWGKEAGGSMAHVPSLN